MQKLNTATSLDEKVGQMDEKVGQNGMEANTSTQKTDDKDLQNGQKKLESPGMSEDEKKKLEAEGMNEESLDGQKKGGGKCHGCLSMMFEPFTRVIRGWHVYVRQSVVFAGVGFSCLYFTVLGFDTITVGKTQSQNLTSTVGYVT